MSTNSLFEEFRRYAYRADPTLHADMTILALLTLLPETSAIGAFGEEGTSSIELTYRTDAGHGRFTVSRASPALKLELKRWIKKRTLARELADLAPETSNPPGDTL
jgi:hypothetical protein